MRREHDRPAALSPSVSSGQRVLQLGDGAEVAGLDLGHGRLRLALQQQQVAEALGHVLASCCGRSSRPSGARHDAEHRDAPGERVGDGLPDERGGGAFSSAAAQPASPTSRRRRERALGRRRQCRRGSRRAAAGCRCSRRPTRRRAERSSGCHRRPAKSRRPAVLRQRPRFEEPLHQPVVGLGDHLDERFARRLRPSAAMSAGISVSLILPLPSPSKTYAFDATEIDHAAGSSSPRPMGSCIGMTVRPKASRSDCSDRSRLARSRSTRFRTTMLGSPSSCGDAPDLLGLHFDARHRIDDDGGGIGDAERGARVAQEVGEAGRVDQVDLGLVPLGVGEARRRAYDCGRFLLRRSR